MSTLQSSSGESGRVFKGISRGSAFEVDSVEQRNSFAEAAHVMLVEENLVCARAFCTLGRVRSETMMASDLVLSSRCTMALGLSLIDNRTHCLQHQKGVLRSGLEQLTGTFSVSNAARCMKRETSLSMKRATGLLFSNEPSARCRAGCAPSIFETIHLQHRSTACASPKNVML